MRRNKMSRKPVTITRAEFEAFLDDLADYEQVPWSELDGNVYAYDLNLPTDELTIRVYSSVDRRTGVSRGTGEHSIKCVVWSYEIDAPVGGRVFTQRVDTWRKNLSAKVVSLYGEWRNYQYKCPDCHSTMALRDGPYGEFLSCTRYVCDHTEGAPENVSGAV